MWVTILNYSNYSHISDAFLRLHQFWATSFQIPNHLNILNNKKNGGAFAIHFLFNLLLNGIPKNPSAIAAASFLGGLGSSPQKLSDIIMVVSIGPCYMLTLKSKISIWSLFGSYLWHFFCQNHGSAWNNHWNLVELQWFLEFSYYSLALFCDLYIQNRSPQSPPHLCASAWLEALLDQLLGWIYSR